jgi:GT2 family glycosyltransferase
MKIAAITIVYNDGYKFKEWVEHYQLYKDELYMHIIVDNGSNSDFLELTENTFKDSIILKRTSNGGCTGAYNSGIRFALSNLEVDAIMLIGNDIKLEKKATEKLYSFLFSNNDYGMVSPIMLRKDSQIIEDYGSSITHFLMMKPRFEGKDLDKINAEKVNPEVQAVLGGMSIAKREFYEKVGLQDENLFMYSDEVDMGIRAGISGFKMAVSTQTLSWHQHINPEGNQSRNIFAPFLSARNKVYLAEKHYGRIRSFEVFFYFIFLFFGLIFKSKFKFSKMSFYFWYVKGAFYGLTKNMQIPKKLLN